MEEQKSSSLSTFPPLVRYPPDILHSFNSLINDEALEELREDFEVSISHSVQLSIPSEDFPISEEIVEEIQSDINSDSDSSESIYISANKDPWTCGICNNLYLDPVESICCHELFCEKCVVSSNKCPRCRTSTMWTANIPVRRIMEEMVVKCRHPLCELSFRRPQLLKHESNCEMALVQCRNSQDCRKICRKDLVTHCEEACEYRPMHCVLLCGKIVPACDLESHLLFECIHGEVRCPQKCQILLQRKDVDLHILHSCPKSVVTCMFFSYDGDYCGYKCFRSELEEHQLTCNLRKVRCCNTGCHQRTAYKSIGEHDQLCKFKKIFCPNRCGEEFFRGNCEEHTKVCELQEVKCGYCIVGCLEVMSRRDTDAHLVKNAVQHSELMINGIRESSFRIEKLMFDMQCTKEIVSQEIGKAKNQILSHALGFNVDELDLYR